MSDEQAAERAELERRANKLFSGRVDFLLSAPQLKFLPEPTVPEIAFCGRSNVGKSSLLNALRPDLDLDVGENVFRAVGSAKSFRLRFKNRLYIG